MSLVAPIAVVARLAAMVMRLVMLPSWPVESLSIGALSDRLPPTAKNFPSMERPRIELVADLVPFWKYICKSESGGDHSFNLVLSPEDMNLLDPAIDAEETRPVVVDAHNHLGVFAMSSEVFSSMFQYVPQVANILRRNQPSEFLSSPSNVIFPD